MKINTDLIGTFITFLIIAIILVVIVFLFWTAVFIPILKRNKLEKEIEEEKQELLKIRAEVGSEWKAYQDLFDEKERLRKSYFSEKEKLEKLGENLAKQIVQKENLIAQNRELKKQKKT